MWPIPTGHTSVIHFYVSQTQKATEMEDSLLAAGTLSRGRKQGGSGHSRDAAVWECAQADTAQQTRT